jgi:translation initiation factor 2 alpha subunit (eIF-2alpha)
MKTLKNCRFHPREIPEVDELVIAKVLDIGDTEVLVKLLEYNDLEGTMALSQLVRRGRIRSMRRVIKVGQICVLCVMDLGKDNHVSLSKRHVQVDDIDPVMKRHSDLKRLHHAISSAAHDAKCDPLDIYQEWVWKLPFFHSNEKEKEKDDSEEDDQTMTLFGYVNEMMRKKQLNSIPEAYEDVLMEQLENLFKPVKENLDVRVSITSPTGVTTIVKALDQAIEGIELPIKITLESSPEYLLRVVTENPEEDAKVLGKVIVKLAKALRDSKGAFLEKVSKIEPSYHRNLFPDFTRYCISVEDYNKRYLFSTE